MTKHTDKQMLDFISRELAEWALPGMYTDVFTAAKSEIENKWKQRAEAAEAKLTKLVPDATKRIEWLESMNTLHGTVEILYVVIGYKLTYVYHDSQIGEPVFGETLAEAIDNAIVAGWAPLKRL